MDVMVKRKEEKPVKTLMPRPWFQSQTSQRCVEAGFYKQYPRKANTKIGERQLGPYVLPPYQRSFVWTIKQQRAFIESVWDGLPLGVYVLNVADRLTLDSPFSDLLLDGQQRWNAIFGYVEGRFKVKGYYYNELTIVDHRRFMLIGFTRIETQLDTDKACRDVYNRLAYGGTPHT
jgi:hypothetical protein